MRWVTFWQQFLYPVFSPCMLWSHITVLYSVVTVYWNTIQYEKHKIWYIQIFSRGTRAQHLTLCVWYLCRVCVCGVPWMDAMLQSVREER